MSVTLLAAAVLGVIVVGIAVGYAATWAFRGRITDWLRRRG